MRTLVLGGTRSGKSAHAERLLADAGEVRYLATGSVPADDAAWNTRVRAHRDRRPERFITVETSDPAVELRADATAAVLLDDLGTWLTGVIDRAGAWDDESVSIDDHVDELCAAIGDHLGELTIVSPEVGLSVVAPTAAGRRFADELGALNARVARAVDTVRLVVAGRVLDLPADTTDTGDSGTGDSSAADSGAGTTTSAVPVPASALAPAVTPAHEHRTVDFVPRDVPDGTDAEVFVAIDPPDQETVAQAEARQLTLTKPPGSLGLLEDLGTWVSACQSACPPRRIAAPAVAVFAGDHGVARDGVSAFPPAVTAQMIASIAAGGAAVNVLARRVGATVHAFDIAADVDLPDGHAVVTDYKVRRSSGDLRRGEALTIAEARRAVAAGRAIADGLVDSGADLLIAGDMGIGNTTPAAVLIGTIADKEPVVVVGRGTGIDDETWIRKTAAIRDGMRFGRRYRNEPLALLAAVGGADLAAMAGFYAQAAVRRTPVILDGVVTTAAALVAEQMAPGASSWWRAGHQSTEPAHTFALKSLGLEPIVDLSMRLGEGTGALTALSVVMSAVDILIDMATFDEAGVSDGA
ncbi:nicotinate-nucleotide--dimethylbenzimidazole phosphoribosyltransferase [Gordonia sp. HY002]|uniref:nicotinate-nucleotide--dimethylbenzimidazole phosphoribosyltransferase n=1 Tax=Gordonia zhenghanii TaxID=2911516 RepID=UPI001EF047BD|nr:nicotinate-nucleotide--dimethylbenzimidazole phosphoribosyltransferase [Gordonia zhenghanii]MCF8570827.1 nicotinate-nucleotide--dimethylbenzimidazole phosphoribosyltransferase [Gordonia zhenghanii]MCF8605309.1 nicotinate-nucleotide--dimethylbenzimidazole phosphoribosyltransferase [Gordonia zhenghanii]